MSVSVLISMTNGDQYVAEMTGEAEAALVREWGEALRRDLGTTVVTIETDGANVDLIVDGSQQVIDRLHLQARAISSIGATS